MKIPTTIDGWFEPTTMRRGPFEGNRVDSERGLSFGRGSQELHDGDTKDPEGLLLHEMAHFLEIDEARCFRYGWGLEMHKVEVMGRMYDDMFTFAACGREIRTMAIQRVLHLHFGASFDESYWAMLVEQWVPGVGHAAAHYGDSTLEWDLKEDLDIVSQRRVERMRQDIVARSEKLDIKDLWALWMHRSELHNKRFGLRRAA